jgi:hypothetical protein
MPNKPTILTFSYRDALRGDRPIAALSTPASCRKRSRRGGTFPINGSRPQDYPHRWASSRVHCIGWFGAGLLGCLRNILDELPNSRVLRCEKRKHSDPEPLLTISRQMMGIKSIDFAKSEVADE